MSPHRGHIQRAHRHNLYSLIAACARVRGYSPTLCTTLASCAGGEEPSLEYSHTHTRAHTRAAVCAFQTQISDFRHNLAASRRVHNICACALDACMHSHYGHEARVCESALAVRLCARTRAFAVATPRIIYFISFVNFACTSRRRRRHDRSTRAATHSHRSCCWRMHL